jgi:hypothetical protein
MAGIGDPFHRDDSADRDSRRDDADSAHDTSLARSHTRITAVSNAKA